MENSSILNRRSDIHWARKIWHISLGLIGAAFYFNLNIPKEQWAYGVLVFALISFAHEFIRIRFSKVNEFTLKVMGPFMREAEKTSLSGMPFYALGVGATLLLFEERIAIISCFFLIFSDPISSIAGILYGRDKILPNKSVQGCIAGFMTCYFLTLLFGNYYVGASRELFVFAIFAGIIGMLSELCSYFIDDNLTIPVISGLGLTGLNYIIGVL